MKRLLFVLCLTLMMGGTGSLKAADQDFRLVNKTGFDIHEVYVSPSKSDSWGKDVMGKGILEDGDSVKITFNRRATACIWDLQVVDEDGDKKTWTKIDLCKYSEITLKYERGKATAFFK